jgi:hypothetical protein
MRIGYVAIILRRLFWVLFPGVLVTKGRKNILEHSRYFYCIGTFLYLWLTRRGPKKPIQE